VITALLWTIPFLTIQTSTIIPIETIMVKDPTRQIIQMQKGEIKRKSSNDPIPHQPESEFEFELEAEMVTQSHQNVAANDASSRSTSSKHQESCYEEHCIYLLPMLGWFIFSSALSLYNKYVFGKKYMAFPCPLLMTSLHFLVQFIVSYGLSKAFPLTLGGDQVDAMPWNVYNYVGIPCGFITSFDVGLSNLSLVRITLTFYTMVKSSSPIFVVISAYIFGIEKLTPILIITVIIISAGELLTVLGEVEFDLGGFVLVLSAAILSGMRWTVVQLQLQSLEPKLKSTIATMRILSPFMFGSMIFLSFAIERPWTKFAMVASGDTLDSDNSDSDVLFFKGSMDVFKTLGIGFGGALLALCMIICEFYLIMKSSAVILMIGGVVKELTTIIAGVTILGDEMNVVNSLGVVVVFSGVMTYKVSHYLQKKEKVYDSVDMDNDNNNVDSAAIHAAYSLGSGRSDGNGDFHDGPLNLDRDFDENEPEVDHNKGSRMNRRRQKKSKTDQQQPLVIVDAEII